MILGRASLFDDVGKDTADEERTRDFTDIPSTNYTYVTEAQPSFTVHPILQCNMLQSARFGGPEVAAQTS